MVTKIYYLRPTAPFHLQTGGEDHETSELYPRSDTLSAAITYLWFRQNNKMSGFPEKIQFRLSSVFPAVQISGSYNKLFPKPAGLSIDGTKHNHKVFKKIRWFDEELFERWKQGEDISKYIPKTSKDTRLKRNGTVLVFNPEVDLGTGPLLKNDARTRVVLDRVNQTSTPFHFVSVYHAPDTLFWFYADIEEEVAGYFETMLRLLGDEGLGADRTIGMGSFELEAIESSSAGSSRGNKFFNLGIFNPLPEEANAIEWQHSDYQLETRRGWVSGLPLRRRPVPCISENAVIRANEKPAGNVVCVVEKESTLIPDHARPDYSIYRDCRGYFIPCN